MEYPQTPVDDLTFRQIIEGITSKLDLMVNGKPAHDHLRESATHLTQSYIEAFKLLFGYNDRQPAWQLNDHQQIEVMRRPDLGDVMVLTGLARWCASDECPHNDLAMLSVMEISSFSWLRGMTPDTFSSLLDTSRAISSPTRQEHPQ